MRGERIGDLAEDVGFVKVPEIARRESSRPSLTNLGAISSRPAFRSSVQLLWRVVEPPKPGLQSGWACPFSPKREDDRIVEKPDASRSSIGSDGNLFCSGARSCTGV